MIRHLFALWLVALLLSSCGGGGGGGSTSSTTTNSSNNPTVNTPSVATSGTNFVPMVLDRGITRPTLNSGYINVTLCIPGTQTCQTIDHVLVDTGSVGLRIEASVISPSLINSLPASSTGECVIFGLGATWGSVRLFDIKIGGETASNTPTQLIGDNNFALPPASCTNNGGLMDTPSTLDANGIIGINSFNHDCGSACVNSAAYQMYFTCSGANCTSVSMPLVNQVTNPVSRFSTDNNGTVISLPAVSNSGSSDLAGTLYFGIGTQTNNTPPSTGVTILTEDPSTGNISGSVNGAAYATAFLDTGTNAIYYGSNAFPICTTNSFLYCPSALTTEPITLTSYANISTNTIISIANADNLLSNNSITAAPVAGPYSASLTTLALGMPFYFGKTVYTAISGNNTPLGQGPLLAYY